MAHGYILVVFFCGTKRIEWLGKIYSKSEIRSTNFETNLNVQNPKLKTVPPYVDEVRFIRRGRVWGI